MSYPVEFREKAIKLRQEGFSIKELAKTLNISVATSSSWVSGMNLSSKAQERLKER